MHCFNCGHSIAEGARFCPRCGAPVSGAGPGAPPYLRPVPAPGPSAWEVCEIALWRGYVKCDFVARRTRGAGEDEIARSPLFPWRGSSPPPREGKALEAFEALTGQLKEAGWQPVGQARPWYAQWFRRDVPTVGVWADEAFDPVPVQRRSDSQATSPSAEEAD